MKSALSDHKSMVASDPVVKLTPAKKEFWNFLEQFNRLPENPTEEMIAVYNSKGIAPEFRYLKASETSVLGDISGITAHRERFVQRYLWVQPLLDQYSIEIPISTERFSGTAKEIGEKYEKLMLMNWKCKATPENEISFVTNYLEGLLVVDFIYACGTAKDKQEAMYVIDGVFNSNQLLDLFRTKLEARFIAPATKDIGWAAVADYPERMRVMTSILVANGFSDHSPTNRVNFHKWMLNTKGISEMESERSRQLYHGLIHNDQVRVGLIGYSIYTIHRNGVMSPHEEPGNIIIKILFKRQFPKDHTTQYQHYITLLNSAYPKTNL